MSNLSAQSIRKRVFVDNLIIKPFSERSIVNGMTHGLSPAGYDVRIAEDRWIWPFRACKASVVEWISIPNDLQAKIYDKSTWARRFLVVQNTIAEPGWYGHLTIELTYHGWRIFKVHSGSPIAQVVFETLDEPTEQPYEGKYQNQPAQPVDAIEEITDGFRRWWAWYPVLTCIWISPREAKYRLAWLRTIRYRVRDDYGTHTGPQTEYTEL